MIHEAFLLLVVVIVLFFSLRQPPKADSQVLNTVRENFIKIRPDYGNIPLYEGDSSYTDNKFSITLCIVDPKTKQYYDMNTIMYVALHELAHIVTPWTDEKGKRRKEHDEQFKKNFRKLLKRASTLGLYNPSIATPETYCGLHAKV